MLRSPQSGARSCVGSSSGREGRRGSETRRGMMAESGGRFCPLCGGAAGLTDRACRWCGESLVPPRKKSRVPPRESRESLEPAPDEPSKGRAEGERRPWWQRWFGT